MIPEYISIEALIRGFKADSTPENARRLQKRMVKVDYFLPLHPALIGQEADQKTVRDGLAKGWTKSVPLLLMDTKTSAGKVLPVFTNKEELEELRRTQSFPYAKVSFETLFDILRDTPQIKSLLINPSFDPILFNRQALLETFGNAIVQSGIEEFPEDTIVTFTQAKDQAPKAAAAMLLQDVSRDREIRTVWLARQENSEQSRWMIVLDAKVRRPNVQCEIVSRFLKHCGQGSAAMCYAEDAMARDITENFEPFFTRA